MGSEGRRWLRQRVGEGRPEAAAASGDGAPRKLLIAFRVLRMGQRRDDRNILLAGDNMEPAACLEDPQEFIGNGFGSLGLRLKALRTINAIHVQMSYGL